MRRTVRFIVALCCTAGGLYLLVDLIFFAREFRGWEIVAAGSMMAIGATWLWSDFFDPPRNE